MSISSHYNVTEIENCDNKLKFHFESFGRSILPKIIEFAPLAAWMLGRPVYNLGFGDNDSDENELVDNSVSNNGDVYKVFNTVLSVIPVFFEQHPKAAIQVRGSDGMKDYFEKCIVSCVRNCMVKCRKEGRRMSIYRSFVNKYYNQLITDYTILGGTRHARSMRSIWEYYSIGRPYDTILIFQKNKKVNHGTRENNNQNTRG